MELSASLLTSNSSKSLSFPDSKLRFSDSLRVASILPRNEGGSGLGTVNVKGLKEWRWLRSELIGERWIGIRPNRTASGDLAVSLK